MTAVKQDALELALEKRFDGDMEKRTDTLAADILNRLPTSRKPRGFGAPRAKKEKLQFKAGDKVSAAFMLNHHTGAVISRGTSGTVTETASGRHNIAWEGSSKGPVTGWHSEGDLEWDESKHPRDENGKFT